MIVAIIQARMGSTRLPGKVLKKIGGKTLLECLILRVQQAKTLSTLVIATSDRPEDESIARLAKRLGVSCFRGSEHDVLDRYYQAAKQYGAETVVRLTGDCPFMDPSVIDDVVTLYLRNKKRVEYVSNVHPPTFPDGMDVEVFSFYALERAWEEARLVSEREHVTPFLYNHPKLFRIKNLYAEEDHSDVRLTVDTLADLRLARSIHTKLYARNEYFNLKDILRLLTLQPKLTLINRHFLRNEGFTQSVQKDGNEVYMVLGGTARKNGNWHTTLFERTGDLGDRLRVMATAMLYRGRTIKPLVVVLGGKGTLPSGAPTVAKIMEEELVLMGVSREHIVREEQSRNTFEQLCSCLPYVPESGTVTFISNRYHLSRIRAFIRTRSELVLLKQLLIEKRLRIIGAETLVSKENIELRARIKDWYRLPHVAEIIKKEKRGVREIQQRRYTYI